MLNRYNVRPVLRPVEGHRAAPALAEGRVNSRAAVSVKDIRFGGVRDFLCVVAFVRINEKSATQTSSGK